MSISPHVANFIRVVSIHFPSSARGDDAELWLASMDRILRGMEPEVLAIAAEIIIETRDQKRDGRFFPVPKECVAACERARERIRLQAVPPLLSQGNRDPSPFASWRVALADELIQGSMGREAAENGWALSLRDFCRRHGRLPQGREIDGCKRTAAGFDDALQACEAGRAGVLSGPLARLGRTMREVREAVSGQILKRGSA